MSNYGANLLPTLKSKNFCRRSCELVGRLMFSGHSSKKAGTYADRRRIIGEAFTPLVDHLEGRNRAPGDTVVSDALQSFDADGVHAVWAKALSRRNVDPEGAITVARTLLETVCKRILDAIPIAYSTKKTYRKCIRWPRKR